jgi:hypothetical protein
VTTDSVEDDFIGDAESRSLAQNDRNFRATALMMEDVNTYETSVNFYETIRRNIPQDNYLQTRRRENIKSHNHLRCLVVPWLRRLVTDISPQRPVFESE